jgi:predicted MFS family arabinose efflux permease
VAEVITGLQARVQTLLREPARPAVVREHRYASWLAVATVCFGAFMGQLDASIVTLAFPALQRQFGSGLAAVQWVSLGYLLTLIVLLVPVGRWSDMFGRKITYLSGFAVFVAASAACGLAGSLALLIGLRVLQAVGAAMLQANSVGLVSTSVPDSMRRMALGIQAGAQALGLALGPVAGGLLVAAVGWRWIFLLNVPVGLAALVGGWFLLPRSRYLAPRQGANVASAALLCLVAVGMFSTVTAASGLGWPAVVPAGSAAVAAVALVALIRRERRVPNPLLDFHRLRSAGTGLALLGALCAYLALFGPLVLLPQVAVSAGHTAARAGLMLAALPGGFGLAAICSERLLPAGWANRRRCAVGGILAAAGLAGLTIAALPPWVTVALLGLIGVGLGVYIPANNAQIMRAAGARDASALGGMVNVTRGFGTALGVAVVTLTLHTGARIDAAAGPALALAALAAAALIATLAGLRSESG